MLDHLGDLHSQHGYHAEGQTSIYCTGPTGKAKIDGLMKTLRESPPAEIGPVRLVEVADYSSGTRTSIPDGEQTGTIEKPTGDLLIYQSDRDSDIRIQFAGRPSGTEPKIKFYFFCQADISEARPLDASRAAGDEVMQQAQAALKEWAEGQLAD